MAPVALALLVVATACGGDDADQAATTTTRPTTTTTTAATSTTEAPAPPPDLWVGVTDDGRLAVVDTATGEQIRTLGRFDHPEQCPEAGEPVAGCQWIVEVALDPHGRDVYYETCCEPAPGVIHRIPIDGGEPEMVAFGAHPAVDAAGERLAVVELQWVAVHELAGDETLTFRDGEAAALHGMTWSPEGDRVAFVVFERTDEPGRLHVLDVEDGRTLADAEAIAPTDLTRSWMLPTFRHDGSLVVVEQEVELPNAPRGPTRALLVDPERGEVLERFDRSDAVLSQRYDPTGTHLLSVLADGSVRWGLDHVDGGVLAAGGYLSAAW